MSSIILHQVGAIVVGQNGEDGYLNATRLCAAYNAQSGTSKQPSDWLRSKRAIEFVAHVSAVRGIPRTDLVVVRQGGDGDQGTWIHPDLGNAFSSWLSVEYEYFVSRWIQDWHKNKADRNFPDNTIGKVDRDPIESSISIISHLFDTVLKPTGMHPSLIASVKLSAIAAKHPQLAIEAEAGKRELLLPTEQKLLTPTGLAESWAARSGERLSAIAMNKKLAAANLQRPTGAKSPSWEAIGRGIDHSLLVAETAKGNAKTIQALKWYPSVLDLL